MSAATNPAKMNATVVIARSSTRPTAIVSELIEPVRNSKTSLQRIRKGQNENPLQSTRSVGQPFKRLLE